MKQGTLLVRSFEPQSQGEGPVEEEQSGVPLLRPPPQQAQGPGQCRAVDGASPATETLCS